MYKKNEAMSAIQWLGFVAVLAGMMCFGSGCAGIELGGQGRNLPNRRTQ